jgi:DNA topoisomerase-1
VQLGQADGGDKPKTCSLLSGMTPDSVTLEDAVKLLSLPRTVGAIDGEPVTAQLGRYGPYVTRGKESRSLEREEQLFTLTLDEAKAVLAQPRQRMRRAEREPLRELGTDPVSGKTITLRQGRFGPYVTDGETNASLRRGDVPEQLAPERAFELLAERRERGPAKPKRRGAAGGKKKATKKAAASKPPAKKKASRKSSASKRPKKAGASKGSGKGRGARAGAAESKSTAPRSSESASADAE